MVQKLKKRFPELKDNEADPKRVMKDIPKFKGKAQCLIFIK